MIKGGRFNELSDDDDDDGDDDSDRGPTDR